MDRSGGIYMRKNLVRNLLRNRLRWWNPFLKPVSIGDVVKVEATVIYTGNSSIHIAVDVYSRDFEHEEFQKTTHCVIVFVSVDEKGKPQTVKPWKPKTEREKKLGEYAKKLKTLREQISEEMRPFFEE